MIQQIRSLPFVHLLRGIGARKPAPTVFHVTHWKAGSQWVRRILFNLAQHYPHLQVVQPVATMDQVLQQPIIPGALYPAIYLPADRFGEIDLPANSRKFVVIRDLRDTLVSAYFSWRYSHEAGGEIPYFRERLEALSLEDGLLFLIDEWLNGCAQIQESWLLSGEDVYRYEDLLVHDQQILRQVLLDTCRLPISRRRLGAAVRESRFSYVTGGRERGVEDINAHTRKGIAGDWRNYFTPRVTRVLNARYAPLLAMGGYEVAEM